jgi:hypothetical protein
MKRKKQSRGARGAEAYDPNPPLLLNAPRSLLQAILDSVSNNKIEILISLAPAPRKIASQWKQRASRKERYPSVDTYLRTYHTPDPGSSQQQTTHCRSALLLSVPDSNSHSRVAKFKSAPARIFNKCKSLEEGKFQRIEKGSLFAGCPALSHHQLFFSPSLPPIYYPRDWLGCSEKVSHTCPFSRSSIITIDRGG